MSIQLRNISRVYGKGSTLVEALKNVSIDIENGEMVAIMGPSGSGKSTLINIVGLLDRPTNGTYLLNGTDTSSADNKQLARLRNEALGFVVQDFALIEEYSVEKNIMMPLLYARKNRKQALRRVRDLTTALSIEDKLTQKARFLSGGQRQRVAIARALSNNPAIILADEPTGALDQKTGSEVMDLFREINKEGKTIIVVTHDSTVADRCDRRITLVDGLIEAADKCLGPGAFVMP